ncbi:MAG: Phage tail tube protein [Myxococcaceae bacterium]|nr:Phage tail tube protein [Myxococcaceae bacterium]
MRQTGRVTIFLNGDSIRSKAGSSSLDIGGWRVAGEPEYTYDGQLSYKEIQVPSKITTTLVHVATTDLHALAATRDAMIVFRTDTKLEYSMSQAMLTEMGELRDGEVTLTFMGDATPTPTPVLPDNPYA